MNSELHSQRIGTKGSTGKGILIGGLLTLIVAGIIVWLATGVGLLQLLGSFSNGHTLFRIDQPTVVRQIAQLQRLETVRFSMDKIISGEHESPFLPKFLLGDRLLLVVHGEVIGGVDLASIQAADVSVKGQTATVRIPKAQILVTRLDNEKTKVYSRDTGLFSSPDPNLESEVRQEAERQLQQAALDGGILKTADDNARTTVTSLLKGFGFTEVNFQ
ncbi:MAG TPA: DUF4230 domain-containing protein [Candidatus Acidoferrum sp.]